MLNSNNAEANLQRKRKRIEKPAETVNDSKRPLTAVKANDADAQMV